MQIHYLRKNEIDTDLWDSAVEASPKGLPYAYSWYLDIVSDGKWQGLVRGNYESVMPLVWNAKWFGIKQIYQPVLTQQLGVFGREVTPGQVSAFIEAIPDNFRYILMNLNGAMDRPPNLEGIVRTRKNLILDLDRPYDRLSANYSRSLRKRLARAKKVNHFRESAEVESLISLYRENLEHKVKLGGKSYDLISRLMHEAIERKFGKVFELRDPNGRICCMGFFLKTPKRIINVFGASNELGRELHSMHFLIDQVIREHAGTPVIFDFEGSEIKGIADFFRSFGPVEEYYTQYQIDRLPSWVKWIRDRKGG